MLPHSSSFIPDLIPDLAHGYSLAVINASMACVVTLFLAANASYHSQWFVTAAWQTSIPLPTA